MWGLITATQFIIYISKWEINLDDELRLKFKELDRCVSGKFMDDLDICKELSSAFGISEKEEG